MTPTARFRYAFESAATRAGLSVIPRLSRRAVVRLSRALGRLAYLCAGELRRTGQANLEIAFGATKSPAEKRRILRASFECFALTLLDVFWFSHDPAVRLGRFVRHDESFRRLVLRPAAQMLVTGHYGNWEIHGQSTALLGHPLMSVAAPLANPAVDELFLKLRRASGQQVVSKDGALIKLIRHLRRGGKVAMLLDQNTKPSEGGVYVDFFGLPVPVSAAAASLALRTRVDIRFGFCVPTGDGFYRSYCAAGIPAEALPHEHGPAAVLALTQRIAATTEQVIREHPEYWLWMYKRWKHVPPGRRREEYPFYSKMPRA